MLNRRSLLGLGVVVALIAAALVIAFVIPGQKQSPVSTASLQPTPELIASVRSTNQPTSPSVGKEAPASTAVQGAAVTESAPPPTQVSATDASLATTHTPVSPEQAMLLVQKAGLDSSQVLSVDLVSDVTGRQYFEIKNATTNSAPIRVDAQTGALLTPATTGK